MNIAIFGYYNFFNAGDDRIQYCIKRILKGNNLVFFPHFLPAPPLQYLNTFDWILIGGGGLVIERVGIWKDMSKWLKPLKANVGIFGLGINNITKDLLNELSSLLDKATFFFVRDRQSKELLNNDQRVEVHPDLTWCFPLQNKTKPQKDRYAINLTPCSWKDFDSDMWIHEMSGIDLIPFPLYFTKERDYKLLQKYFGNSVNQEFSLEPLLNSEMLIACRYHAIIFAMQLGIPFIAIAYDDKVRRLLEDCNLSYLCLNTDESHLLKQKIDYIKSNKSSIIKTINKYAVLQQNKAQQEILKINYWFENSQKKGTTIAIFKRKIKQLVFNY